MDIDDRKTHMCMGAKTAWSAMTRDARVSRGEEGTRMCRSRNLNHVVAAGPKITVWGGEEVRS